MKLPWQGKIKPLNSSDLYKIISQLLIILMILQIIEANRVKYVGKNSIVNNFIDNPKQNFSHLVVDKTTGSVYVGGLNRLYHFNSDLEIIQTVKTGPVDNPDNCVGSVSTNLDNNYNKALVLDNKRSSLIVCGTINFGTCQVTII